MLSMMNISVKTRKMLSKGCIGYLVHMVNKVNESIPSLQNTPIVYEFQDLFVDNLSRLGLKRKVKFSIKLAL